jgi:hypothetical protein
MGGMSVTVTYTPDPAAIKELGFMAGMRAFTADVAIKYAQRVLAGWPRGTGRTRRSVRVTQTGTDRDSAYTRVSGPSSFWHFIEYGSIHNPPYAPFRNAAASMGLRFDDPGKGGGNG